MPLRVFQTISAFLWCWEIFGHFLTQARAEIKKAVEEGGADQSHGALCMCVASLCCQLKWLIVVFPLSLVSGKQGGRGSLHQHAKGG